MDEQAKYDEAKQRVQAMKGFYIHFAIYVVVILGLIVVNVLATPTVWWAQWPLLGWGVGVAAHGFLVFGRTPKALARWEERKINEIMKQS